VKPAAALLALILALVAPPSAGANAEEPAELLPGMSGVVRTALLGDIVEEIPLTFLGTYENVLGPGFDLHLVQLEGPLAEKIGVANGMSGSPVYIEGELIGALAYRLGFMPRVPVAGVTPIKDIRNSRLSEPPAAKSGDGVASPIGTPVQMSNVSSLVREWAEPQLKELGFMPVSGGGVGEADAGAQNLEAGSPIGIELVRGDLNIAATGTVTLVESDRVYAFGHSFLSAGRIELPMVAANVVHTLADAAGSVKLTSIGPEIGTFTEDRLSAIVGSKGVKARMMPVDLRISGASYGEQSFHFELARQTRMAPLLAALVVANSLSNNLGYDQKATLLASGNIRFADLSDLPIEMAFANDGTPPVGLTLAQAVQRRLEDIWTNPFFLPEVEGLDLEIEILPEVHRYHLDALLYDRGPLRPGQNLEVQCLLRRYRGEARTETLTLQLPPDLPDGTTLTLAVGSPAQIQRALGRPIAERLRSSRDLETTLRALSDMRSPHRLTAVLFRKRGAVVTRGTAFEQLPPTAEHLLATRSSTGTASRAAVSSLVHAEIELDGPVGGGLQVKLRVDSALDAEEKQ
jgi:hypothetical protein